MTQKHTPEPWARGKRLLDIVSSKGNLVARLAGTVGKCEIEDANLRRIVACVNACAGIPDEQLESLPLGGVLNGIIGMASKCEDLQEQVDELLKAAENLLSNVVFVNFSGEWNTSFVEDADLTEYCQPLQDVINKITGEPK